LNNTKYHQWRTEEGVRGVRTLPLAYDLRNKRVRMHQNMAFSTKNTKKLGRAQPPPQTLLQWGGGYPLSMPHPPRRLRHLDPSHFKSWVRH